MVLTVHGSPYSTCSQRIFTVFAEKGVEHELVEVNLGVGEQKQAPHLKIQPFGRVPVLDDDGFLLYESRAIAKYVAKKYAGQGTKLIPDEGDLKAFGLFEQACSVEQNYFDGPVNGIAFEKVFKGMKGLGGPDEELVTKYAAELDGVLAVYDGILAKQKYLAGDEITLPDIFHLPYGSMVRGLGYDGLFEKYPNVKRWWDELVARESWKKVTGGK